MQRRRNTKVYLFDCKHSHWCNIHTHTHVEACSINWSCLFFVRSVLLVHAETLIREWRGYLASTVALRDRRRRPRSSSAVVNQRSSSSCHVFIISTSLSINLISSLATTMTERSKQITSNEYVILFRFLSDRRILQGFAVFFFDLWECETCAWARISVCVCKRLQIVLKILWQVVAPQTITHSFMHRAYFVVFFTVYILLFRVIWARERSVGTCCYYWQCQSQL